MTSTITTAEAAWLVFAGCAGMALVFAALVLYQMSRIDRLQARVYALESEVQRMDRQMINYLAFGRPEREPAPPPAVSVNTGGGEFNMGGGVTGRDYTSTQTNG